MNKNEMTSSKRLIYNAIANLASRCIIAAIAFFMVPFFIRTLGKEQYGIWLLVASVFTYRTALDLGLNSAINRYIPVFLANDDYKSIEKVINTSVLYLTFTSILLIIITFVIHGYFDVWFSIPPNMVSTAKSLVLIVGFSFAAIMPLQIYSAILSSLQRYDLASLGTLLPILARTLILVLLLSRGYSLIVMGLSFGFCEIAIRLLQLVCAKKLFPYKIKFRFEFDFILFRKMLYYGCNTLLYTLGAAIIYKSSDVLIGIYLETTDITNYNIALATTMLLQTFTVAFVSVIKPAISDLDARDERAKICNIAFWSQKYTLVLLIPAVYFFIIMGKDFLKVWVGPDFEHLYLILILLSIAHFFRLVQYSNFLVLVGRGQHQIFGIFAISTVFFSIVLAIIMLKIFNLGLLAIALSHLIPITLISGLILPAYFNHKMNLSFKEFFQQSWWPAFISCLPALLFISLWKYFNSPDNWFKLVIIMISAFSLTIMSTWLWGLSHREKQSFRNLIVRKKIVNNR